MQFSLPSCPPTAPRVPESRFRLRSDHRPVRRQVSEAAGYDPSVSADVATVLGSAFTAAILTTFASRWIAGFQARKYAAQEDLRRTHETEQARLADQRSLRDQ